METFSCDGIKDKIAIYDLQYERNCSTCKCVPPTSNTTCEKFKLLVSWRNNYFYDKISGLQGSTFRTQWFQCPISPSSGERLFSNQMHLKYRCINGKFMLMEYALRYTSLENIIILIG